MAWPRKYTFPRAVGEFVVIRAASPEELRRIAHAAHQAAYRKARVVRCRTSREEMAVRVTRVV